MLFTTTTSMVVLDNESMYNIEELMGLSTEGTADHALDAYFEAYRALARHRKFAGFTVFEAKDFNNFLKCLYKAIAKETGKDLEVETDVLNVFKGCRLPQRGRYLKDFLETEKVKL